MGNFYEVGETEFLIVHRNLTYDELLRVVQGVANVDLRRFTIELRPLVDIGVRLRPARPKIKDDSNVEMLLCDDQHVPEVYVSAVRKLVQNLVIWVFLPSSLSTTPFYNNWRHSFHPSVEAITFRVLYQQHTHHLTRL